MHRPRWYVPFLNSLNKKLAFLPKFHNQDILKAIPGITEQNYKQVVLEVDTIMELGNMSERNLVAILGPEAARRVHGFFDTSMYKR